MRFYLAAVILVGLTFWLSSLIPLRRQEPFAALYLLPIILSAYLGGLGPGLLATVGAALLIAASIPIFSTQLVITAHFAEWAILIGAGALMSVLSARMHHDVSAQKRAETALLRSEHILKLFVEHAPAAIAMFDHQMVYMAVSRRFLADYQLSEQDLVGRSHYDVFPEVPERWKEIHRRCLAGSHESAEEDPFLRTDGRMDWIRWELLPWYEQSGEIGGILLFSEVITARKHAEMELNAERTSLAKRVAERTAELQIANDELARAARLKDEFLASMSHELRTPLTTILGRTELLHEQIYGPINAQQTDALESINSSGRHLLALINDILDLSKIEANKLSLQIDQVDIHNLCKLSIRMIAQSATNKQITLTSEFDSDLPALHADERRLKQILVNLLDNAVKFTPKGGHVGLEVHSDQEQHHVIFSVWDTGIGIAAEDRKQLFTPFTQIDGGLNREYSGTGLGLSLVLRLTEAHHGSVDVESTPGRGSRFSVRIPF